MLGEQRDNAVCVHVVALSVAGGNAVGVAIVDEQRVIPQLGHLRQTLVNPGLDGLGVQPGERGVLAVVDFHHFHAHIAQKVGQVMAAGAVKRVAHHAQAGGANGLHVHQLA